MELIVKQSQIKGNFEYKVYLLDELIYTGQVNRMINRQLNNNGAQQKI